MTTRRYPAKGKQTYRASGVFFPDSTGKDPGADSPREITKGFRILFDEVKLKQGLYQQENDRESEHNGVGWPKGTWFQKRLRLVRQQQRKKLAETDLVYECALGTITIRQSYNGDSS